MPEREYRQDDRDIGYCPTCGAELSGLTVAATGYCKQHGWVYADWTPRVRLAVSEDYDNCPDEDWGEGSDDE